MAHTRKKHPPTQSHETPSAPPSRFPRNVGILDRGARVGIALLIGLLFGLGELRGTLGTVLAAVAVALLISGIVGMSLLYLPFGIDTRLKESRR